MSLSSTVASTASAPSLLTAVVLLLTSPGGARAALTFSTSTGMLSGTHASATIPSVTAPAAAALLGTVGYSTDAKLIYGPFEAGFGSSATASASADTRPPFPCVTANNVYSGYCPGGMDVGTCESSLAKSCAAGAIVRTQLFMDSCGGHAMPYHYHTDMVCHYDQSAAGHSTITGVMLDGRAIYGRFESTNTLPTDLDACGGHVGKVPAYTDWGIPADTSVYHYHSQTKPPYLLGCYGPATLTECKAIYSTGDRKCDAAKASVQLGASYYVDYDLWCPCYDQEANVSSTTTTTTTTTGATTTTTNTNTTTTTGATTTDTTTTDTDTDTTTKTNNTTSAGDRATAGRVSLLFAALFASVLASPVNI